MNVTDMVAIVGAPFAAAGAVVATLAWRTSAGTRRDQAEAEARRRHREMRPMFDVSIDMQWPPNTGLLVVKLTGPREVEAYDWIRVEIRDDGKNRQPSHKVTADDIRQQVWGPFQFYYGTDGAEEDRRTARQGARAVTDSWLFRVDRTYPPRWYSGGDAAWRKDYEGKPVRLRIEVGLGGQTWTELIEVPQPDVAVES